MSVPSDYLTVVYDANTLKTVFVDKDGKTAYSAPAGMAVRVPTTPKEISTIFHQSVSSTALVIQLPPIASLPIPVISTLPSGTVEQFASSVGFRYNDIKRTQLTAALWLDFRPGGMKAFQFILGGPTITMDVAFAALLGLDGREAGAATDKFTMALNPDVIKFLPNMSVTEYEALTEQFRGSLASPGVNINWAAGPGVYTR